MATTVDNPSPSGPTDELSDWMRGVSVESKPAVSAAPAAPAVPSRAQPPSAGASFASQVAYIKAARQRVIQHLAVQFKQGPDKKRDLSRVPELELFLAYLNRSVIMTPQLRAATHIDKGLDLVADPKYCFPGDLVAVAAALKQKWEGQNWGAVPAVKAEGDDDNEDSGVGLLPAAVGADAASSGNATTGYLPPPDHPIYGKNGIMHGVIITKSTQGSANHHARTVYRRHPSYRPRDAHVFGDNGLAVGDWWPLQLAALFHGAHGSSQGGIAGSARHGGAYSIVVAAGSNDYGGLDDDRGDVVFYSGSRSHENRDPARFAAPPSPFTQALVASRQTGNPVRVLRSASGKRGARWAPSVGIRYDGLYRVVDMQPAHNEYGGLFERFELRRLPGQTPLEDVRRASPTAQQRRDYAKIPEGY